jgi:UDP-N-acetylglucosamine/UDP-N-acetylgalactosamine diphosphorylase
MLAIPEEVRTQLRHHGQEHVLHWWSELTDNQRHLLLSQLRLIDVAQLQTLFAERHRGWHLPALDKILPAEPVCLNNARDTAEHGEKVLRRGEMAALVVAGGQGSRLGATQPKGMFAVGPVSGNSLYQIHAEKVLALRRRYQCRVPLLVMTSPATDHPTREYFAAHQCFGLPPAEVHFFCQGTMPALDKHTGKLLLADRHHLCLSPNGHGGTLLALSDSGLLHRLREEGIRHVYYFQVDNPLVQIGDLAFLGHHCASRAELSLKVVPKFGPADKLGNVVEVDGRCGIVEYFLLPPEWAESRDEKGRLRFAFGSPAIHLFDLDFLERVLDDKSSLPFHLAEKKVPCLDATGRKVEPVEPNAYKFEMFIFDVFPRAERWAVVLTACAEEFAPLKNETGPDSPETVRRAISRQAANWLRRAGAAVPDNVDQVLELEISPLFALDAAELKAKIGPGIRVERRMYLR